MYVDLNLQDCEKILYVHSNGKLKCTNYEVNKISAETLGFLGEHFILTIKCEPKIEINFFVKAFPNSRENLMEYVKKLGVFKKETLLYQHLLPQLQKLSLEQFSPKCFLIKAESLIVLENLCIRGYENAEEILSYNQCEALLKTMANFHSASIIYEEKLSNNIQQYRLIDYYPEELQESTFIFTPGHPREQWLHNTCKAIVDCLKLIPKYSKNYKISKCLNKFVNENLPHLIKPSKKYRNVISHADLWKNNALFKTDKNDGCDCILIDFQLARYAPPTLDILTALYLNVPIEFLEKNVTKLLEFYHNEFCANLKLHSINPNDIMDTNLFVQSVEEYKTAAWLEASLFATIVFVNSKLSKKIMTDENIFQEFVLRNRSKYACEEFKQNKNYRERCSDIFSNLADCLMTQHI